jgi:hypothetical protein
VSADSVLTRRSFGSGLVAAATVLATSGCDTDDGFDLPGIPDAGEEPDHDQVLASLRDELAVLDQVQQVQRRHRSLRRPLAATAAVHEAHVELLTRADDTSDAPEGAETASRRVPADPSAAVALLVRLERSLATKHVETAMASRSGVLARVVATMSAAAAQQAHVLSSLSAPDPEPRP